MVLAVCAPAVTQSTEVAVKPTQLPAQEPTVIVPTLVPAQEPTTEAETLALCSDIIRQSSESPPTGGGKFSPTGGCGWGGFLIKSGR